MKRDGYVYEHILDTLSKNEFHLTLFSKRVGGFENLPLSILSLCELIRNLVKDLLLSKFVIMFKYCSN